MLSSILLDTALLADEQSLAVLVHWSCCRCDVLGGVDVARRAFAADTSLLPRERWTFIHTTSTQQSYRYVHWLATDLPREQSKHVLLPVFRAPACEQGRVHSVSTLGPCATYLAPAAAQSSVIPALFFPSVPINSLVCFRHCVFERSLGLWPRAEQRDKMQRCCHLNEFQHTHTKRQNNSTDASPSAWAQDCNIRNRSFWQWQQHHCSFWFQDWSTCGAE